MMQQESLILKADARAQRRLRTMVETRTYGDPLAIEPRLYTEAERLVDALLANLTWETRKAEFDLLQSMDHDYHLLSGAPSAECDDCPAPAEPGDGHNIFGGES